MWSIYCCTATATRRLQLQEFVAEGVGLADWGHHASRASQNPGPHWLISNAILNSFGLSILLLTLAPGCFPPSADSLNYHFRKGACLNSRLTEPRGWQPGEELAVKTESGWSRLPSRFPQRVPAYASGTRPEEAAPSGLPAVSPENPGGQVTL